MHVVDFTKDVLTNHQNDSLGLAKYFMIIIHLFESELIRLHFVFHYQMLCTAFIWSRSEVIVETMQKSKCRNLLKWTCHFENIFLGSIFWHQRIKWSASENYAIYLYFTCNFLFLNCLNVWGITFAKITRYVLCNIHSNFSIGKLWMQLHMYPETGECYAGNCRVIS